jgi:hypothetical protein
LRAVTPGPTAETTPENVRQRDRHRVFSGAHDEVERAVHRHCVNPDDDLPGTGNRRRDLFEPHHLGPTEFADDDGFHGSAR